MPEIGSMIGVYNGKTFNQVEVKPEMIGHYIGKFSITYKPVKHALQCKYLMKKVHSQTDRIKVKITGKGMLFHVELIAVQRAWLPTRFIMGATFTRIPIITVTDPLLNKKLMIDLIESVWK